MLTQLRGLQGKTEQSQERKSQLYLWALPHRKQKEDVKLLKPLFPQAEWIFSSSPSFLHQECPEVSGLSWLPMAWLQQPAPHAPAVYLLRLHSQLLVPGPEVIPGERHRLPVGEAKAGHPSAPHTPWTLLITNFKTSRALPKFPGRAKI